MIVIRVGVMMLWLLHNSWTIIHFGRNPDNGGSPPSDKRVIRSIEVSTGVLFHEWDIVSVEVLEIDSIMMNIDRVRSR